MSPLWTIVLISQLWLIATMFTEEPLAVVYTWVWIGVAVWAAFMMRDES